MPLKFNIVLFSFFHSCTFRVDTKQGKMLQTTAARALGLLWARNTRSKQKPTEGSRQTDSWSSDV